MRVHAKVLLFKVIAYKPKAIVYGLIPCLTVYRFTKYGYPVDCLTRYIDRGLFKTPNSGIPLMLVGGPCMGRHIGECLHVILVASFPSVQAIRA